MIKGGREDNRRENGELRKGGRRGVKEARKEGGEGRKKREQRKRGQ